MPFLRSKRKVGESETVNQKPKKNKTTNSKTKTEIAKGKAKDNEEKKVNTRSNNDHDSAIIKKTKVPILKIGRVDARKIKKEELKQPQSQLSVPKNPKSDIESGGDSSECEWEEVEELQEPVIPKDGVTITIEAPNKKKNTRQFDIHAEIIRRINRFQQETQLSIHKVHLLCLLAYGLKVNCYANMKLLRATALSLASERFLKTTKKDVVHVEKLLSWFKKNFELATQEVNSYGLERLKESFESGVFFHQTDYFCAFLIYLRILNFDARLVVSFRPSNRKLPCDQLIKHRKTDDDNSKKQTEVPESSKTADEPLEASTSSSQKNKSTCKAIKAAPTKKNENVERRSTRVKKLKKVNYNDEEHSENETKTGKASRKHRVKSDSSSDFEALEAVDEQPKPKKKREAVKRKRCIRQSADKLEENIKNEMWIEVLVEMDDEPCWVCVDVVDQSIINDPYDLEKKYAKPFDYVVGFDSEGWAIDITRRYAAGCLRPEHRKRRVDPVWWEETLKPFQNPNEKMVEREMRQMNDRLLARPLPTSFAEFKGHPFYILQKHLLKFEGIYPPDAVPVGYFRKEPVYSRDCVHELHARETWFKEARLIKRNETAYKTVKPRPRWNKVKREIVYPEQPLEIFGRWQTEDYVPPVAANGIVPRNEHGNVDFLKPCMLPVGTVHLRLPGLIRVAKKLNIDCAAAFVGWDFSGGSNHPCFDGWVVCKEFEDVLVDAWREEQDIIREREQTKKDKRVYGNWKRLIKGVLIAERLKARYLTK